MVIYPRLNGIIIYKKNGYRNTVHMESAGWVMITAGASIYLGR